MDYDIVHPQPSKRKECAVMTLDSKIGLGKWKKTSCDDANGYVCLKNVDPSLPDSPEPTTSEYVQIFNDSFKVVTQQMTWDAAKKHCDSDGARLARVGNEWSKAYIELLALKGRLWIGMNKKETGGYFRYVDGWRMTLTNWDYGEPRMDKHCVFVQTDGKWKTANCNQNMTTVCMKSIDVPPTQSSEFPGFCPDDFDIFGHRDQRYSWLSFRGYCYLFVMQRTEWPQASANCIKHGGNLASIEDPLEQDFIQSTIKTFEDSQDSFWIGLYKTHRDMWLWLDKTVMDYTNWAEGQPYSNEYGAIGARDGRWSAGNRWNGRAYICKTAKVLREAPQTAVNPSADLQTRGHMILAAALVIAAIAIGTVITLFLFKKSGRRLPIPEKLSTFDNPLFFNNERSQPDLVDTNKLVANAEEENTGAIITV